jgi:hypothetical protein
MHILNNRHEYGPMHNTMELLKQINKLESFGSIPLCIDKILCISIMTVQPSSYQYKYIWLWPKPSMFMLVKSVVRRSLYWYIRSTKLHSSFHMDSYTFSPTTITNNWSPNNVAENKTRCISWFTTNRSSRALPSHRTYTHNPKPNKPVVPQLATSQQLQLHATHTKNC